MNRLAISSALALVWAASAHAQEVRIEKDPRMGTTLTQSEIAQIEQFKREYAAEQQVILLTCREHMFSKRDQAFWNLPTLEGAIFRCAIRGEAEYVTNYQFLSPFLRARITMASR